jgi:hypothetical protein
MVNFVELPESLAEDFVHPIVQILSVDFKVTYQVRLFVTNDKEQAPNCVEHVLASKVQSEYSFFYLWLDTIYCSKILS